MSNPEPDESAPHPLSGVRVLELGSRVSAPYVGKLFVDAGAACLKVESLRGDPLRRWSASGATIAPGQDGAWWRFLNAGKTAMTVDLETDEGRDALHSALAEADLVIDDHAPADALALGIDPASLRQQYPSLVVATLTSFGTAGPWADRPANDFTLQALVGATDARGVPGEEPVAVGGDLGDIVAAAFSAPAILAYTLASQRTGEGAHLDVSQYEAMMLSFQTYRPIFDTFAPDYRPGRQIEVPSIEPAKDGSVGFCTITGQQWQDFCAMIGAPQMAEDPGLARFDGRMNRRDEVWGHIRAFTEAHTVDEIVEMAALYRIPCGPIGAPDVVADIDHFVERGVFVDSPHGFSQPRPPYQFSTSRLAELGEAPGTGDTEARWAATPSARPTPRAADDPPADGAQPLAGVKVLDLSAFWAGPVATNLLRVLGADLIKVESHVRLDGMRWASGLPIPMEQKLWEWSPVYHGANVGKRVVNLDLSTEKGLELLHAMVAEADLVVENYSPRVAESWGVTWDRVHEMNPRTTLVRVPAFGVDGPWRDRTGFAMTMEQVSGLAHRTGHADGPSLVPRGPVDSLAGMHAVFGSLLALAERDRTGEGQLVELALIEGALQAAAEQLVEYAAYGNVLTRQGNRSPSAAPQGLYPTAHDDQWLAVSIETDQHWSALQEVVPACSGLDRRSDHDMADDAIASWSSALRPAEAEARLWRAGVPASVACHLNDTGWTAQHHHRGFLQWARHDVTDWTPYPSFPFQVDGAHLPLGGSAPLLGQHTDEVLHGLGCSADDIRALRDDGVTGDWPAMVPRPLD